MAASLPCAAAQLLCHVRHGHSRFAALHLTSPHRAALLARPGRAPLRALAQRSGAAALLLRKPAPPAAPPRHAAHHALGGRQLAAGPGGGGGGEAVLVLCGPRLALEAAQAMVEEWLRAAAA